MSGFNLASLEMFEMPATIVDQEVKQWQRVSPSFTHLDQATLMAVPVDHGLQLST